MTGVAYLRPRRGRGPSDQILQIATSPSTFFEGPLKSAEAELGGGSLGEVLTASFCTNAAPWTLHLQNIYHTASFLANTGLGVGQHPETESG